jgi:hypothetical protein
MRAFLYCKGAMSKRIDALSRRDLTLMLSKEFPNWRRTRQLTGVRIKTIRFTKSCMYEREFRRRLARYKKYDNKHPEAA